MTGAWIAAIQERMRLRNIKGYGSGGRCTSTNEFAPTQMKRNTPKQIRNVQLPPKVAILSARRSPKDHFCSNSASMFDERSSCSRRLRTTSCSREDSSPLSDSSKERTYFPRIWVRSALQIYFSDDQSGKVFRISSAISLRTISPETMLCAWNDLPQMAQVLRAVFLNVI